MANSKAKLLRKLMAKQKSKLPLPPITPPPISPAAVPPMGLGASPMGGGMPPQQPMM